ncbi:lipase family protein [Galactobacter sp.]|uniref:lipase family protein n=1 Tax=Galactobacter sp. TaxID=2676125 RepID=UPI0025C481D9|nr:lipase family protein [Galactobacter sp.]
MGTSRRRLRSGGSGLRTWYGGLPAWARAGVGLGAAVLGVVLLIRPTTSLGVLALVVGFSCLAQAAVEVLDVAGTTGRRRRRWVALIWLVLGVFVLVWPGLTVRLLAVAVGIGLIVNGISDIVGAKRAQGPLDSRIASALLGAATVGFGVVSLAWPDITMIVVAVAFGARLISTGVMQLWRILHRRPRSQVENVAGAAAHDARPGTAVGSSTARRWFRTIGAALAVALATGAGALSVSLHQGSRVTDAFYAAPRTVPSEPGRLIRSEPFTRGVPENATGYRILCTTTQQDGSATVASGLVVVPRKGAGDWPVVDWTHGTTGVARQCAPSLLSEPFESGALFVLPQVINHGWALVATDYIGLGTQGKHPYLIGRPSAHASLDAVRAARQLDGARLGKKTVAWGHSQGGGAALWTGALAKDYAPDVHVSGVAALAPATNLPQLTSGLDKVTGGSVFGSYVISAYAAQYPDVTWKQYVRPGAEVVVRQMSTRCLSGPDLFGSVLTGLATTADPEVLAKDPPARRSGRG